MFAFVVLFLFLFLWEVPFLHIQLFPGTHTHARTRINATQIIFFAITISFAGKIAAKVKRRETEK